MYGSDRNQVTTRSPPSPDYEPRSPVAWTKLTIPQQSGAYLKRSRLIDMIHNVIDRKLILVRAPAGYGKTSLLIELAQETDLLVCWYALEEQDADLNAFVTYLVSSIAHRFPSFAERSTRLLQWISEQQPAGLRILVATLANEILQTVPEYFFLVLDDYHVLDDSSNVHQFVRLLIDFMPEQCHLIISSRTVPPLPLIRLVARQQMAAIGVDDLRFCEDEIHRLADEQLGLTLSTDQVQFLAQQTDGWITGILLSADLGGDTLLQQGIPSAVGLTESSIYDYLMSEVFGCQPPDVQRFLTHTAVLSEMTAPLCNELLGKDFQDMLQRLERHNLFVTRLEDVGLETTYRYHPLFRDFLLSRLRAHSEETYRDLNARAASYFAGKQDWRAAVIHSLRAERFDQVRQIILTKYDALDLSGLKESMVHWIDALPLEYVTPQLQLRRATLATELGDLDTALRLHTNAIITLEGQGSDVDMAYALIERSYALSRSGGYQEAIQDCQQALSLLGDEPTTDSLRGRAYRYLGVYHTEVGQPQAGLRFMSLAEQCWERCQESSVRIARLARSMGVAYEMQGQFTAAIEQYTRALTLWNQIQNDGEVANALNGIGVAHHRLGEYRTALQVLHDALQKSQAAGAVRAEAYTLASLGDLYRDLGRFEEAIRFYDQGLERVDVLGEAYLRSYIQNARADTLHLAGNVDGAQAEIAMALSQGTLSKIAEARCQLILAATLNAQHKNEQARRSLASVLSLPGVSSDVAFRGHLELASAAMQDNQPQETSAHLDAAFQLACSSGLTQSLSVEALHHLQVLQYAAEQGAGGRELGQWIARAKELERTRSELINAEQPGKSSPEYPTLEIRALGNSSVMQDGVLVSWRTTQAKELFFYLLSHPNGQTKEQIGAAIWPDHSSAKLFSIFRSSLFRLRKALFSELVMFEDEQYRLSPQVECRYDVHAFEREFSKGMLADNPVQKAYHYRRSLDLYLGEFLSDLYSSWLLPVREALRVRQLQALRFLAEFQLDRGQYAQAIEFARQILTVDEYHEAAYYVLIRSYVKSGQRPQAKRIYERCRQMLASFDLRLQRSWEELCR